MNKEKVIQCDNCGCKVQENVTILKAYNVLEEYYINHYERKHICATCSDAEEELAKEGYTVVIKVSLPVQ